MTRFEAGISGKLGDFRKKYAEKKMKKAGLQADREAIVEPNGAIRWITNGHYIPDDYLRGVRQDPAYHPKGGAFIHTMKACGRRKRPGGRPVGVHVRSAVL